MLERELGLGNLFLARQSVHNRDATSHLQLMCIHVLLPKNLSSSSRKCMRKLRLRTEFLIRQRDHTTVARRLHNPPLPVPGNRKASRGWVETEGSCRADGLQSTSPDMLKFVHHARASISTCSIFAFVVQSPVNVSLSYMFWTHGRPSTRMRMRSPAKSAQQSVLALKRHS